MTTFNEKSNNYIDRLHLTKKIHGLLIPWLSFRLYIHFKSSQEYGKDSRCHFYGQEQRCTYNQCIHGHVETIILDKLAGYNNLVHLVEKGSFKGKYKTAKIYSRTPGLGKFDILHREYYKGKLNTDTVDDPVLDVADQHRILYYKIENKRLVILEAPEIILP